MPFVPRAPLIATTQFMSCKSLGKLLLDEEGSQMRKLPYASDSEDDELDDGPFDDAGVCVFGLVAELGFAFLYHVSTRHCAIV